ncbi:MAG: hypothetical protein R8K22_08720, partial [Mariprofundaceae bacterium]
MNFSPIKYALSIGQRVLFFLIATAATLGAILWWNLPDLKTLQPEIETFLKQEMDLQDLQLGDISWHWAGNWGVTFKNSSLVTQDDTLRIQNSDVTAYIALSDIFSDRILPNRIRLIGGSIHIKNGTDRHQQPLQIPPVLLILEDVHIYWKHEQKTGDLAHVGLDLNILKKTVTAFAPGLNLDGHWQASNMSKQLNIAFEHLDWLPETWKKPIQGTLSGFISLQQLENGDWKSRIKLHAPEAVALNFPDIDFRWPFNSMALQLTATPDTTSTEFMALKHVQIKQLDWQFGDNQVHATGTWREGSLKIDASSPYFEMPIMWSFLHPIDENEWDTWLNLMQHGSGHNAEGGLELDWEKPWQQVPSIQNWNDMRFHMTGQTKNADIFLGMEDAITHTNADVTLDEKGLQAIVHDTELPHDIGHAKGKFYIPWDTLILEVHATGDQVDAGKLHTWLDADDAARLHYGEAPAHADISLVWMPEEESPRSCTLKLKPTSPWLIQPQETDIKITGGEVTWRLYEGIWLQNMQVVIDQLSGTVSATAHRNKKNGQWGLSSLDGKLKGPWAHLVSKHQVPIEDPAGNLSLGLRYDGNWHGSIDALDASWTNILGSKKEVGQAFKLLLSSDKNSNKHDKSSINIPHIQTISSLIKLNGHGIWTSTGLRLNLSKIDSPAFNGQIKIWAPFNDDPLELDITAQYLSRKALPSALPETTGIQSSKWVLRSKATLFEWDDAKIYDADIQLASAQNS